MQNCADRTVEDSVKVVQNHLEPNNVGGQYSYLSLEVELKIDFEELTFEEFGIREPDYVDIDSSGNIYLVDRNRPSEYFIIKFDRTGKYIKDIGKKGQGPGEIQQISLITINSKDQIMISDRGSRKILVMDCEGFLIYEKKFGTDWRRAIIVENGNYIVESLETNGEILGMKLSLYDSDRSKIKDLDFFRLPHLSQKGKKTYTLPVFYWRVRKERIYIGNEQRGYEIWVFDIDGNFILKISKEYSLVKYPEEYKKETLEIAKNNPQVGPIEYLPPFNSFFIDDYYQLFVMTYETKKNSNEYMFDIFNSEGIFILKRSLPLTYVVTRSLLPRRAVAKQNRYFCISYKENGFAELIIFNMTWKLSKKLE